MAHAVNSNEAYNPVQSSDSLTEGLVAGGVVGAAASGVYRGLETDQTSASRLKSYKGIKKSWENLNDSEKSNALKNKKSGLGVAMRNEKIQTVGEMDKFVDDEVPKRIQQHREAMWTPQTNHGKKIWGSGRLGRTAAVIGGATAGVGAIGMGIDALIE